MECNPHKLPVFNASGVFLAIASTCACIFSQSVWRADGSLPEIGEDYFSIAYGNNRYVATGQFGTIVASPDSISWFGRAARIPDILLWSVSYVNGQFLTTGSNTILASLDGIAWNGQTIPTDDYLIATAFGNGTYVATGTRGTIFSSTDLHAWIDRSLENEPADFYSVCFGNGLFVAVNIDANDKQQSSIYTSPDGTSWTEIGGLNATLWQVTFGNGLFVAVGENGVITSSTDGSHWTPQQTTTTERLMAATFGEDRFVAAGDGGTILVSPDGYAWTDRSLSAKTDLYAVTYGTGKFVAVGDGGAVFTAALDETAVRGREKALLTDANTVNFNFGGSMVRISLPADASGNDLAIGLYTVTGKLVSVTRLKRIDGCMNVPFIRCAPGTYILTIIGTGVRKSMPMTVTR